MNEDSLKPWRPMIRVIVGAFVAVGLWNVIMFSLSGHEEKEIQVNHTYKVHLPIVYDCSNKSTEVAREVNSQCSRWSRVYQYEDCSEEVRRQMCKPTVPDGPETFRLEN